MILTRRKREHLLAAALGLFLLSGAIGNLAGLPTIMEDYARWGYPSGFNYVTGFMELIAAALVAMRRTRRLGALLGAALMGGAGTTLLLNGEYVHAMLPAATLAACALIGRMVSKTS